MANVPLTEKLALLEDPRAFPDRPARVERLETHFAWIFLSPRFVYKLKKPIRFGSIDFRNAEARRAYCELEVTLNRRLAEATYRRVASVSRSADGLELDGEGDVVDAVVVMRRLPDKATLADADPGSLRDADVDRIVGKLVEFYTRTPKAPWDGREYVDALARSTIQHAESLAEASDHGIARPAVQQVAAAQLDFIERHRDGLERRAAEGRIVDTHGDLRAEHVFVTNPIQIIDCLEFSIDLRWLDTAEELAFLALDCDRRSLGETGARLLAAYRRVAEDRVEEPFLAFYRSRRALARAVIAAWRVPDAGADADVWRQRARWYFDESASSIAAAGAPRGSL